MRGLNEIQIGIFYLDLGDLPYNEKRKEEKTAFYRSGKYVGEITYDFEIIKKNQIPRRF